MIGVVVWVDAGWKKAVIWCEDHRDLAYYVTPEELENSATKLRCGDVVSFDLTDAHDLRIARNVCVVEQNPCCDLVQTLMSNTSAETEGRAEPMASVTDLHDVRASTLASRERKSAGGAAALPPVKEQVAQRCPSSRVMERVNSAVVEFPLKRRA